MSLRGTVRKVNEDRLDIKVVEPSQAGANDFCAFAGVYDGHGGAAVAEWLTANLQRVVQQHWGQGSPEADITEAYLEADKQLLVSTGFMGMGERGIGGSKCGATAVNALLFAAPGGAGTTLLTANVGDARILLIRDGQAVCLTEEHVPDAESERQRIERQNPNPKMPMVRYVGGTWRVGGLLALSRAFGDSYLKGSLQFEGVSIDRANSYSSGFGVVSTPHTTLTPLTPGDSFLVLASDGLFNEEARGGGGGLDEDGVAELCRAALKAGGSSESLARTLAETAVAVGSTDDVTVVVMRLGV